jgi:hypothetical protein
LVSDKRIFKKWKGLRTKDEISAIYSPYVEVHLVKISSHILKTFQLFYQLEFAVFIQPDIFLSSLEAHCTSIYYQNWLNFGFLADNDMNY